MGFDAHFLFGECGISERAMNEQLKALIEPVVNGLGCQLWAVEYVSRGKRSSLRVFIDAEDGVDVEDCARVSRQLGSMLDVEDPVRGQYTLEVSSPGLDRRLYTIEQFERFKGAAVKVSLRSPFEGRRRYTGILCGIDDGRDVVIRAGDQEYLFPLEQIEKANVVPGFREGH
jgi:ribosome maturation factor RimP